MTALAKAIARLEGRFGAGAVVTATRSQHQADERRFVTGTSFDALAGGIASGSALAFVGSGSSGKVTLALRAAAGAQAQGGMALWLDPSRSLDPLAAARAGVELARLLVVRPSGIEALRMAAAAALRSDGFRLVVADLGPAFLAAGSIDDLAPVLPAVRGSTAALLVVADERGRRLALPTFELEPVAWATMRSRGLRVRAAG